jgi:hypothetical protein
MSYAHEIAGFLEDASLNLTLGTNLFVASEPLAPSDCVTVYDSGGGAPEQNYDGTTFTYYPRVQIRVRNDAYLTGDILINDIRNSIQTIIHQTVEGRRYMGAFVDSGPAHLGKIDTNAGLAHVWTLNIRLITET